MPKTTRPLSRARWAYLKALPANTARMIHVSARIGHGTNPVTGLPFSFVIRPGETFRRRKSP